jgi:hypothetical protein
LLAPQIAQSGDHLVAERAGGEGGVFLDQRHRETRVEAFQRAGAGRAGKAAADHDDPAGGTLRQCRAERHRHADGEARPPQEVAPRRASRSHPPSDFFFAGSSFCSAYHAAIAASSSSVKPLAMRSITVAGRVPARNPRNATTVLSVGRPASGGTGVCTEALAA